MHFKTITLLSLSLLVAPLAASAATISDLFNTGVNGSGAVIADGAIDSHYTILAAPNGAQVAAKTAAGYPLGVWQNNDSDSAWIGPNTSEANGPGGYYVYRTTFTLAANAILSSVSISGFWGTDDFGSNLFINGVSTGQTAGFASVASAFSVTSNFHVGVNTLDFQVGNSGGPTGLRVDGISGSYQTSGVPDGSLTVMLLGASLLGMLAFRRKFTFAK